MSILIYFKNIFTLFISVNSVENCAHVCNKLRNLLAFEDELA